MRIFDLDPNALTVPKIKEGDMGEICSTHGTKGNAYKILIGIPEEKRHLGNFALD
jgi:hypothetical protein